MTRATALLDIESPNLQALVASRGWRELAPEARVGAVYTFVRDEIRFGYNTSDDLPASRVLADGYGQCNTKTTLLMALLRAVGVECRFHGATIHKSLQKGVVTGLAYRIAPRDIVHSWAEVRVAGEWVALEGVILDREYLDGLRGAVCATGPLLGYGAGTDDIANPPIDFKGTDTAIQTTGINGDLGVFDSPDEFYSNHGANFRGVRRLLFERVVRHRMNRMVQRLRRAAGVEREPEPEPRQNPS